VFTNILHKIASHPRVYDCIQLIVGAGCTRRRLAESVACLDKANFVIDLGGGTGIHGDLWHSAGSYVCLDVDILKLEGFRSKCPEGMALLGDATKIPVKSNSIDVIMCTAVSHHLSDEMLSDLLDESARVLRTKGTFIFVDAVWKPERLLGRLLWKYDRGSAPRTAQHLQGLIEKHYELIHIDVYSVWHEYLLCVGSKESGDRKQTSLGFCNDRRGERKTPPEMPGDFPICDARRSNQSLAV